MDYLRLLIIIIIIIGVVLTITSLFAKQRAIKISGAVALIIGMGLFVVFQFLNSH